MKAFFDSNIAVYAVYDDKDPRCAIAQLPCAHSAVRELARCHRAVGELSVAHGADANRTP